MRNDQSEQPPELPTNELDEQLSSTADSASQRQILSRIVGQILANEWVDRQDAKNRPIQDPCPLG